jgi:hypothetical protein
VRAPRSTSDSLSVTLGAYEPVPTARPLSDFTYEEIGDELVLFDFETKQYHTVNAMARKIWQSCDGISSVETIAASTGLPCEIVEVTIAELAEASLFSTSSCVPVMSINRRRAAKMIAGGIIGLPVVLSITAPHASAQASQVTCVTNQVCPGYAPGTQCTYQIWSLVCCHNPDGRSAWVDTSQASSYCAAGWNCGC